jgi:hypothetical protein
MLVPSLACPSFLKLDTVPSSEESVDIYQTTRCYILRTVLFIGWLPSVSCLGLPFYAEDGDSALLRSVRRHLPRLRVVTYETKFLFMGSVCCLNLAGCLLGLPFYPEYGGSAFVPNVCRLLPDYSALHPPYPQKPILRISCRDILSDKHMGSQDAKGWGGGVGI